VKRWGWWVAGGGAVVVVAVVVCGLWGLQRANTFEALARAGKADAKTALHSLEAGQAPAALASFLKAKDEFAQARALLGPEWVRGLPWLGRQLDAADDLTTIGVEGATAGAAAAQLLGQAEQVTGDERLTQLVQLARPHLDAALVSLVAVAGRSEALSADGLVPQLAGAVTEMKEELAPLSLILHRSQSLLDLERYLFSTQHRFLLLSQNGAQLRPTGGFPGTYGLVEFGPDGFELTRFDDIYTLPRDTLDLPIPAGGQVNVRHFFLRNANAWMDFPTSAEVITRLYRSMKQPAIDGVIAIDIPTIRDLLKVFGPIRVPESKEALSAENVLEQLSYVVSVEYSGKGYSQRKDAVVSLAKALIERLSHLTSDEFLPTMASVANSANQKHIQIWFADPAAQADIVAIAWSGAIDPPPGTTDLVAVSNSVVKRPAKANLGVTKTLDYDVQLNPDGSADTRLMLGYKKSFASPLGDLQEWLANYVRIHRSEGTTATPKGTSMESLDDETGLTTFGHYFRLDRGTSTTIDLRSHVPQAVRTGPGVESADGSATTAETPGSWHYSLVLARQCDIVDTRATVTVHVPEGWRVASSTAWLRATGSTIVTTGDDASVTLTTPLKEDLVLNLDLTRG